MAIDSIVEKLVKGYEEKGVESTLNNVVENAVLRFMLESPNSAQTSAYLSELAYLFGKGHIPYRYMFEYLSWRIPKMLQSGGDRSYLSVPAMINELEALWYAAGMLPLTVNKETGEKILLKNPEDYSHLRPINLGVTNPEKRNDIRAFRLYRRVTEASRNHGGPNWTSLLNIILSFPLLMRDKKLSASYREIVDYGAQFEFDIYIVNTIEDYLTGQKEVVVNEKGDKRTIQPLSSLELLMPKNIGNGYDKELTQLLAEVKYRSRIKQGWPWGIYLNRAGKTDKSIAYHGMPVSSRMVSGKWNEEDDYNYQKAIALGRIPVTYNGKKVYVRSRENTHVFMGFKKPFRTPDKSAEELIPVFKRARIRYEHGTTRNSKGEGVSPAQLLQRVFQDPEVIGAIGEVTLDYIESQWYLTYFKDDVRSLLLGKKAILVNGHKTRIRPNENLYLLRPESPNAPEFLYRLSQQMRWHWEKTGLVFYDFIDLVGAEPEVIRYHRGNKITREAINPNLARSIAS